MSEFKGTEGKWKVIDGKASGKQIISESAPKNRMNVASCGGQRREENANLIAAAPELLEALKGMLNKAYKQNWNDHYPDEVDAAQAALTKALGQ
ncbi:hypothetical protein [Pantoea anthophila]|uniref:hypothetical protein n=1 Tax=Pantoea anthophila TaxID=470931 RepID=UPI003017BB0B